MATHKARVALPPEIIAERRRKRARTVRLYAIGIAFMALLIGGIFVAYDYFAGVDLTANQHTAAAMSDYARGNLGGAEHELRTAVASRGDDYTLRYDLGIVLLKEGRYAGALVQ